MAHVDTTTLVAFVAEAADGPCEHFAGLSPAVPSADGCEDCLRTDTSWVRLRPRLVCGHAGCCDSSPHHHASTHATTVDHPVITSLEQGEAWGCCYPDGLAVRAG